MRPRWFGKGSRRAHRRSTRSAAVWNSIPSGKPASPISVLFRLPLVRIEVLPQAFPAIDVVVLQGRELRCMARNALREAGLEHERHRAGELHRLQLAVGGMLECLL